MHISLEPIGFVDAPRAKARRLLGWRPRNWEEAVVAMAESLFKLGIVTEK